MFILNKFSLIILTRCNLRCKLCCEYVPQNKSFPDMTVEQEQVILDALFLTVDRVATMHLTGGGEPFLHKQLAELVVNCMEYSEKFDRLMLFTNCTIMPSTDLLSVLKKHKDKILVQISRYGIRPECESEVIASLKQTGVSLKVEKYYGEDQSFGGWVDFGEWKPYGRTADEASRVFQSCAVTRDMHGNWRTRDGKIHWCTRSQRGMELGLIPNNKEDYVNLFDDSTVEEKRAKFERIANTKTLSACDYCSGEQGTSDERLRFAAAEQIEETYNGKNSKLLRT